MDENGQRNCQNCHWRWVATDPESYLSKRGFVYCEGLGKMMPPRRSKYQCVTWQAVGWQEEVEIRDMEGNNEI